MSGMKRVLILDDEQDIASTLGDMLGFLEADLSHEIAGSVEEAMILLENSVFDCIISDINLPGLDGLSFIAKLREMGFDTPVIITSGLYDTGLKEKIIDVGGFDFLPKPFDIAKAGDVILASLKAS